MEREAQGSTGVGRGVAVPHAPAGRDRSHASGGRAAGESRWRSAPWTISRVDLLFALFAPETAKTEHLRALARVSRLLRQGQIREQLRQARSPRRHLRPCLAGRRKRTPPDGVRSSILVNGDGRQFIGDGRRIGRILVHHHRQPLAISAMQGVEGLVRDEVKGLQSLFRGRRP